MAAARRLVDICFAAVADDLLYEHQDDYILSGIFELPSELLDGLLIHLTPLALQKLQENCPIELSSAHECGYDYHRRNRKRKRYKLLDDTWHSLCEVRWPHAFEEKQAVKWSNKSDVKEESIDNWQQMYWGQHLQDCVDAVAEAALLPSYSGSIGEIKIPDDILKIIGCKDPLTELTPGYLNFSYHCQQFGAYSRHLRLPSALCVTETCDLLQTSKLVCLEIQWIKTNDNVEGLCKLLKQNSETLKSVHFIHCKLSPTLVNAICDSMQMKCLQVHGVEHFTIKRSSFFQTDSSPMPSGFASFLTSGKHLLSLTLCDNHLGRNFARGILDCLLDAATSISVLDLSENNISGFISHLHWRSSSSSIHTVGLLQTLRVLNLRGCNLEKDDIYCLRHALPCLPNLVNLDLSDNVIGDGIRSLIFYFNEISNRDLPFADLKLENCELTCNQVIELLDVLPNLKKPLNLLSIKGNRLGSKIGAAFGKYLRAGICAIDVEDVGLGCSGFVLASKEITEELEIAYINISNNQGGIEAANFISTLVSHAHNSVVVDAKYNSIPAEALAIICSKGAGKLKHLDLSGNRLCGEIAEFQKHRRRAINISCLDVGNAPYDDDP